MRQECLLAVGQVLGRKVTNAEGNQIVENIRSAMSYLSKNDPDWGKRTHDERVTMAAKEVSEQIVRKATRKKENIIKQAIKQRQALLKMDRLAKEEDTYAFKAMGKMMTDIDHDAKGVANNYLSDMFDTLTGLRSKWLGMVENTEDVYDFVRESYGESTGNEHAKKAYEAWTKTAEDMRIRANRAGADIGKLDYGYIPQSHDGWKMLKARKVLKIKDKTMSDKEAWVDFIAPLLDRKMYVDENGNMLNDMDYYDMLGHVYDNITTNGSVDEDLFVIASKRPEFLAKQTKFPHRKLHFANADAWMTYQSKFAKGSLSSALIGHVQRMSRTIALMESWGPQPQATFDLLKYTAQKVSDNAAKDKGWFERNFHYKDSQGVFVSVDQIFSVLNGEAYRVETNAEGVANFMQGWRNLEIAGKLGKAFITSFSDVPTYFIATGFNRLGWADSAKFMKRAYGKDWKEYAARTGLMAEGMISDFNRWAGDNVGQNWTGKVAEATMRASLLTAFTDATRRAFSLNMMATMSKLIETDWDMLSDFDRARLVDAGIDEMDWSIYQATGAETFKGVKMFNAKRIRELKGGNFTDDQLARAQSKILAWVVKESEMASLNPDLITRASSTRGLKKGTMGGEISRALFLFKSFPIAMMKQHYERTLFLKRHGERFDRLKYIAALTVSTTAFGALSLQVQNVLNGKDTQDMSSREFWLNALAKGGGLGFLGDFIANQVSENARYGAWSTVSFLGPQASTALEVSDTLTKAMGAAIYDKETKPAASALRIVKSHTPFINMWYTQTVLDRYIMNDIQEYLSPGYLARMERRTKRSWGQEYWWGLRDTAPRRAPRMATQPN